jgi:hypothetical protein
MSLNIAEKLHSRRNSVSSTLSIPVPVPSVPTPTPKQRSRSNSILNVVDSLPEKYEEKPVVEEHCKEKKGLKSLHCIVESLQSKLLLFEQQFKKDNDKINSQEQEISKLKETIKDILDG